MIGGTRRPKPRQCRTRMSGDGSRRDKTKLVSGSSTRHATRSGSIERLQSRRTTARTKARSSIAARSRTRTATQWRKHIDSEHRRAPDPSTLPPTLPNSAVYDQGGAYGAAPALLVRSAGAPRLRAGGLSDERCKWRCSCRRSCAAGMRSAKVMANALSAGFHRIAHRV